MITVLRWQFDLVWSLFELHLGALRDSDVHWEPAPRSWAVRRSADGRWLPDWVEPEPDPPPPSTVAWLTWHIGWWWGETIACLHGNPAPARADVAWPGSAADAERWLRELRDRWADILGSLTEPDLRRPAPFPWRDRPDRTVAHTVAWVNAELMKNVAEIGQLRLIHAAAPGQADQA